MNRLARIAIVQDDCLWGEKAKNIEKAAGLIKAAAQQNAGLVLFPEMYLTGYALEDDIQQRAEAVSGPSIDALAQIAKTNQICICMGFPELDPASRQIFNSLVCLSDRGDILAVYRKIHLFDEEKKYFSCGREIKIVETPLGRTGFLICYDLEFPEMVRMTALQGAEVVLVATANMHPWSGHQDVYLRARAMENQIFLALANRIGREKDLVFCGSSGFVDPMGHILAQADAQSPALLIADMDPDRITAARSGSINYLRDRRPEIYQPLF
jgi:predicted amidohydrolase